MIEYLSFSSKFLLALAKNGVKGRKNVFRLIDITIDIIFFSINWKNYFDRSILVISMKVLWESMYNFELGDSGHSMHTHNLVHRLTLMLMVANLAYTK